MEKCDKLQEAKSYFAKYPNARVSEGLSPISDMYTFVFSARIDRFAEARFAIRLSKEEVQKAIEYYAKELVYSLKEVDNA